MQFQRKHGRLPRRAPPPSSDTDNVSPPLFPPSSTAVQEISHPPSTAVAMATQGREIHSLSPAPPPFSHSPLISFVLFCSFKAIPIQRSNVLSTGFLRDTCVCLISLRMAACGRSCGLIVSPAAVVTSP